MLWSYESMPWPVIIFGVIILLVILGIIFLANIDYGLRNWLFFIIFVLALIWLIILYFFCWTGYHAFAWFLLLLPLTLFFTAVIAYWLATQTTCRDQVLGHWVLIDLVPQGKRD